MDRPSAGYLADVFAPPSGVRDVITELSEDMDRLKAANKKLEAKVVTLEERHAVIEGSDVKRPLTQSRVASKIQSTGWMRGQVQQAKS